MDSQALEASGHKGLQAALDFLVESDETGKAFGSAGTLTKDTSIPNADNRSEDKDGDEQPQAMQASSTAKSLKCDECSSDSSPFVIGDI